MIHTRHPISECEVCAAQVEADEVGAIPTMGHDTDADARIAETHSATDCNGPDCGIVIAASIRSASKQPDTLEGEPMTQPSETQQLKPCYCRSSNSSLRIKPWMDHGDFACKPRGYHVFCGNCWACGPTTSTEADAPTAWNKFRAPVDSQGAGDVVNRKEAAWAAHGVVLKHECVNSVRAGQLATEVLNTIEALPSRNRVAMCAEKVKRMREKWWAIYNSQPESVRDPRFMKGMDAAAGQVITELVSLTLDQVKQEKESK